jgi:hypothetical protein
MDIYTGKPCPPGQILLGGKCFPLVNPKPNRNKPFGTTPSGKRKNRKNRKTRKNRK